MITSTSNSKVKNVALLQKKAKERRTQNAFVVEGARIVSETPMDLLMEIYMSESFEKSGEYERVAALVAKAKDAGAFVETVSDNVFEAMSDTVTTQGILAVVKKPEFAMRHLLVGTPHILVVETLQDPGNLGTIFRTAEGAGATGIIMNKTTVDLFSPKVVRSTMGSIYRMPHVIVEDLKDTIRDLQGSGITFYAAHLKGEKFYDEFDYTKPTAFLIGNEGNGLSDEIADAADEYMKIPMEGQLESLNAAMAAGILMYEAHRQRSR